MVESPIGYLRPAVSRPLDPAVEARALAVCPGAALEGAPASTAPWNPVWGPVGRLAKGHATDESVRHRSGSGGVIAALCRWLLDSGQVEAVLHVVAQPDAPLRSLARVSETAEEVMEAVGARYGPAAPLADLETLLESGRRFAFVGKPCDVSALRLLARQDPRIGGSLVATISFLCGGVPSLAVARGIVGRYGLRESDVKALRWRGHGCPGMTHIESRDGRVFQQTYDETWGDALNQEIQFRCKVCPDAVGLAADIVCGDAWITEDGYAHGEYESWNAVIGRTERGLGLLAQAEQEGALHLAPLALSQLDAMQPHHVERREAAPARLLGLRAGLQPAPGGRGLGLLRVAWHGRRRLIRNFFGTLSRVRRGRNREPLPREAAPCRAGPLPQCRLSRWRPRSER